jgi:hypothetical protein
VASVASDAVQWVADAIHRRSCPWLGEWDDCRCPRVAAETNVIEAIRAALAEGDPDVAEALGLTVEWGIRFERTDAPTMDNASGVHTVDHQMPSADLARRAVLSRAPISARNRRVVSRVVGVWREAKP